MLTSNNCQFVLVVVIVTLQTGGGDEAAQAVRQGQAQPCVGILKTPGKRKTSNNRVEFLDNLQEREIPGRHT